METTLIIIILLLIGAFNLLTIGVLIAILNKLIATPFLNKNVDKPKIDINQAPQSPSPEELEADKRKRKAYEDQLTAINEMLNYNADVAYGIKPKDEY